MGLMYGIKNKDKLFIKGSVMVLFIMDSKICWSNMVKNFTYSTMLIYSINKKHK